MRSLRRRVLPAITAGLLLAVVSMPLVAAQTYEVSFQDAADDPASAEGAAIDAADYRFVDIRSVESRVVDDQVEVRVTFAEPARAVWASYWLTVDFEGDAEADLSIQAGEGIGILRGESVYWPYPREEADALVYILKPDQPGWTAASFAASKWRIATGGVAAGGGSTVTDTAEGGSDAGGGFGTPAPGAPAALAVLGLAAGAFARRRVR